MAYAAEILAIWIIAGLIVAFLLARAIPPSTDDIE